MVLWCGPGGCGYGHDCYGGVDIGMIGVSINVMMVVDMTV